MVQPQINPATEAMLEHTKEVAFREGQLDGLRRVHDKLLDDLLAVEAGAGSVEYQTILKMATTVGALQRTITNG